MLLIWLQDLFKQIRDFLAPSYDYGGKRSYRWDSWQTFLWLAVFSAFMSSLARGEIQNIISSFGWVFLILGVWWYVYQEPVKKTLTIGGLFLGPWIVGALTCVFLFGSWRGANDSVPYVAWPPISFIYAALPKFIKSDPKTQEPKFPVIPAPPVRQELVILLLSNLILSCWFQFNFSLQSWLQSYPSLAAEDFRSSAFVYKLNSEGRGNSRGNLVLELAETQLKEELRGQPWSEVERWLLDLDQNMTELDQDVRQQLADSPENGLWHLKGRVVSGVYDLELQAVWSGPSASPGGYYLTKSCQITQVRRPTLAPTASGRSQAIASVRCGPTSDLVFDEPASTRSAQ